MKRVDRLRMIATELATNRGHVLDRFKERCFRPSVSKGYKISIDTTGLVRSMSSYCVKCKMPVVVIDRPPAGEPEIAGDATTLNCPNGSAPEDILMKMSFDAKTRKLQNEEKVKQSNFDRMNKRFGLKN